MITPDEMRGRVSAVSGIFIGASNELGEFESGVTAAWWGAVTAVLVGGISGDTGEDGQSATFDVVLNTQGIEFWLDHRR